MTLNAEQSVQQRYHVTAPLGEGGMGTVYRARNSSFDVQVAIGGLSPSPTLQTMRWLH